MIRPFDGEDLAAHRLRTIGTLLAEAAFAVSMRETRAGLELTAILHIRCPVSIDVAEDGHTELRFWTDPHLHPRQFTAALIKAADLCRAVSATGPKPPTDVRQWAERLPPGHPSSPYETDGTRKPPSPDLSSHELSLPDEPGFPATGEPDRWASGPSSDPRPRTL